MVETYNSALVLGLGASGLAASRLLLREGSAVTVVDAGGSEGLLERAASLRADGAEVVTGCVTLPDGAYDICVTSPGVRADSTWIRHVESRGVDVISELALGASRCRCPLLAITGTNGKTTMVNLCCNILSAAGLRAKPAGNYGIPLCTAAPGSAEQDWLVVEVSSFQMEHPGEFRPQVGLLLNIQPDHLDRHENMRTYTELKARMFTRMTEGDVGVTPEALGESVRALSRGRCRWVTFGETGGTYVYADGRICVSGSGQSVALNGTPFSNDVLGPNVAGAAAATIACGATLSDVASAAAGFEPLPHRMQHVATIRGVKYVNDSKATNLAALVAGVTMVGGPVRLIAGGLLKEKNLDECKEVLAKAVKAVYLIGSAAEKMACAWSGCIPCWKCGTLGEALQAVAGDALEGETVLLSPGCASFDQFTDYQARGNRFIQEVRSFDEDIEEG